MKNGHWIWFNFIKTEIWQWIFDENVIYQDLAFHCLVKIISIVIHYNQLSSLLRKFWNYLFVHIWNKFEQSNTFLNLQLVCDDCSSKLSFTFNYCHFLSFYVYYLNSIRARFGNNGSFLTCPRFIHWVQMNDCNKICR